MAAAAREAKVATLIGSPSSRRAHRRLLAGTERQVLSARGIAPRSFVHARRLARRLAI
jgi:hypothetical protein